MIVEDNLTNRSLLKAFVRSHNVEASEAVNGLEGVKECEKGEISLIFMDINMPVMNGVEAMKKIRKIEGQKPYIVVVTANSEVEKYDTYINAGADLILEKPISKKKIGDVIESLIAA